MMLIDLNTVAWKEWIEWKRQYGNRRSTILINLAMVVVFSILLPLQFGEGWFKEGQSLYAWLLLPVLLLLRSLGDSIAGERERHTLETLLATRLPDKAVYIGKMLVPAGWTWFFTQLVMLVALIPLNIFHAGEAGFYQPLLFLAGLFLSMLSSIYAAAAGVYLSIRSSTVDQANQSMFLFLVLFVVFDGAVIGIASAFTHLKNLLPLSPWLAGALVLFDVLFLILVSRSFDRKHLIL